MGLATIAAVLEQRGYAVSVLDANVLGLPPEAVVPRVAGADVIGLTATTPTVGAAMDIARHLKQARPELPVILGGAHATLLPGETLAQAPEIDIIVRGEGEETVLELLPALEAQKPLDTIAGISYRRNGEAFSTPPRSTVIDMDALPFLAYHLLPWRRYRPHPPHGRALPFAAVITSRGCPYHCAYCSKPVFGRKFRAQRPERVVDEVANLQDKFGIREIAFYDDVFTLDQKRAGAIADGIIKRGLKVLWTCETRVNLVDPELLRRMKQSGCYGIAYGIESASPEILRVLSKDITLEQAGAAVRMTREAGIQATGYFMIGSPGESVATIKKTIRFARDLKLDFAQFAATLPFPGTELYKIYRQSAGRDIPWESLLYSGADEQITPVFESAQLSRDDIKYWIRRAYREFYLRPAYIWKRLRRLGYRGELRNNLEGFFMLLKSIVPARR